MLPVIAPWHTHSDWVVQNSRTYPCEKGRYSSNLKGDYVNFLNGHHPDKPVELVIINNSTSRETPTNGLKYGQNIY